MFQTTSQHEVSLESLQSFTQRDPACLLAHRVITAYTLHSELWKMLTFHCFGATLTPKGEKSCPSHPA